MRRTCLILLCMAGLGCATHAATPVEKLRVMRKLKTIIIPEIRLRDASIVDAFQFIRDASRQADTKQKDPLKKGVNIVLKVDAATMKRKISFQVRQLSVLQVLDLIVDVAGVDYRIEKGYVMIVPRKPPVTKKKQ